MPLQNTRTICKLKSGLFLFVFYCKISQNIDSFCIITYPHLDWNAAHYTTIDIRVLRLRRIRIWIRGKVLQERVEWQSLVMTNKVN